MNQMPTRPEESMMQKTEQIAETQNSIMRK